MAKGRRGRPAKGNAVRRLSPSRRPKDHGTLETQKRRREALGCFHSPEQWNDGTCKCKVNETLSTHAIDRAFAQDIITEEQRKAAWRYTCLNWSMWGKGFPKICGYQELIHEHLDFDTSNPITEERQEELAQILKEANWALHDTGYATREIVRELCRDVDIRSPLLKSGLTTLVKLWGFTH